MYYTDFELHCCCRDNSFKFLLNIEPLNQTVAQNMAQHWASVVLVSDGDPCTGPSSAQHWVNLLCLLAGAICLLVATNARTLFV